MKRIHKNQKNPKKNNNNPKKNKKNSKIKNIKKKNPTKNLNFFLNISKMVQKSESLKNHFFSQKKTKFLKNIFFFSKKKSLFLNIRTTQLDQSSPVQPNPEKKKKSWKILKNCTKLTEDGRTDEGRKSLCLILEYWEQSCFSGELVASLDPVLKLVYSACCVKTGAWLLRWDCL